MAANKALDVRPVLHIVGMLLVTLGAFMLVPGLVDLAEETKDRGAFFSSSLITIASGVSLIFAFRGEIKRINVRQTYLLTTLAWLACTAFGALPFMFTAPHLRYVDAFFETMSGLTTTGATVMTGLNTMDKGILLWRALLHWIGGIGIVAMAVMVLPVLRVGGMQVFRSESSERSEKLVPTARGLAGTMLLVYVVLTIISMLGFVAAGMSVFDAICHSMAAIATGGFSTKDESLAYFDSYAVDWVATFSMLAGALPLIWYVVLVRRHGAARASSQVLALFGVVAAVTAAMTLWAWTRVGMSFFAALTHSATNVSSIISTTGFVSTDYAKWGTFTDVMFFLLMFVGGCTGSTSGSIKIFRWEVLTRAVRAQLRLMLHPHRMAVIVYEGKILQGDVVESVISYFFTYVVTFALLSTVVAAFGADFITSISGVAATLGAVGPGLGDTIGPAGNYAPLSDGAKWTLTLGMLLGRLELFTVYMLLTRSFWRP
ncbi:MAG: TrkH family potassium uptake protein [Alphaproteobacteria bacterium]